MNDSRRSFIKSASVLPTLGWQTSASKTTRLDSSFDPWIEIHSDHLRHNVQEIQRRIGARQILAVIKNNGYGLGVVNVARLLEPMSAIAGFAVVKLHEAVTLRDAALRKPVLLMGPVDEKDLAEAVRRQIMPMVYTPIGSTLEELARRLQQPIPLHICVDTGIGRVGVPHAQAASLIRDLAVRKGVRIQGTM